MQYSILPPLLFLFILVGSVSFTGASNETDTIIDSIAKIATIVGANKTEVNNTAQIAKKVVNVVEKVVAKLATEKTLKQLQKVTSALAAAGPPFVAVAMFLSVLGVFASESGGGSAESAEMLEIKKGFENVDRHLNVIDNTLQELKNLIQMSSAQVGYLDICNTIDNLHSEWSSFTDSKKPTVAEREEFLLMYNKYNFAALNLWRGMVPAGGNALAFDLMDVYKNQVNCNPVKLQLFCANIIRYINKGLVIEGAYHGLKNLTEKARRLANEWEDRMKQLVSRCETITNECNKNWLAISTDVATKAYDKFAKLDNGKIAEGLFNELSGTVPQRKWAVWVYDDASGFAEHTVNGADVIRLWDKYGKDVTVVGHDEEVAPLNKEDIDSVFETVSYDAKTSRDCLGGYPKIYKEPARAIVDQMKAGVTRRDDSVIRTFYAVQSRKNVAFRGVSGRYFQQPLKAVCIDPELQVFVVQ